MITVKSDRTAYIPEGERNIGYENDHLVEERLFEICDAELVDFSYKLDIKNTMDIVDLLPVEKTANSITVKWKITSGVIGDGGIIKVQIRAFDKSGERVWHSEIMDFFAQESVNAEKEANDEKTLSEFEELETRVQTAVNSVEVSAAQAKACSETAQENANIAVIKAESAVNAATSAVLSDENAKSSKTYAHTYAVLAENEAGDAKKSCDQARLSASSATDSASVALEKANIATEMARVATEKASGIVSSASMAQQNAISAQIDAENARTFALEAQKSCEDASASVQQAEQCMENANASALAAQTASQNALQSEQNAKASEEKAKEYASIASGITEYIKAENVIYDNSMTNIKSTNVGGAINELSLNLGGLSFSVSETGILTIIKED